MSSIPCVKVRFTFEVTAKNEKEAREIFTKSLLAGFTQHIPNTLPKGWESELLGTVHEDGEVHKCDWPPANHWVMAVKKEYRKDGFLYLAVPNKYSKEQITSILSNKTDMPSDVLEWFEGKWIPIF